MEDREIRGLQLAATKRIQRTKSGWKVPSQSGHGSYAVRFDEGFCDCPDHEARQIKCKHLFAVEYALRRETGSDGAVCETESVRVTRMTYRQNWTAYNAAQTEEKSRFASLLGELCKDVPQPEQAKGRPRLPLGDMVFASAFKVYSGFSSRRFTSDLREAQLGGHIASAPHFNSVNNYLASEELTPILHSLVTTSSLPLRAIETDFAVDSSGFTTSRFIRWYDKKYGRETDNREWVKVHLMCGVRTNIVTGVEVSDWMSHDSPYLAPLAEATARNFQMAEVSADKAYLSRKNVATIVGLGATPYIPFKVNSVVPTDSSAWQRMYYRYALHREEFLQHYHKRSNVETVFSMIKGKFGDALRTKGDTAQFNEVLCKVLCHNICVLIQSIHELGIEPDWAEAVSA